jgi:hypothetical protein
VISSRCTVLAPGGPLLIVCERQSNQRLAPAFAIAAFLHRPPHFESKHKLHLDSDNATIFAFFKRSQLLPFWLRLVSVDNKCIILSMSLKYAQLKDGKTRPIFLRVDFAGCIGSNVSSDIGRIGRFAVSLFSADIYWQKFVRRLRLERFQRSMC